MDRWITGLFPDERSASLAADALQRAGVDLHDVSVLMTEATRVHNFRMDGDSFAGGAVGAVVAGLTGTGSVATVGTRSSEGDSLVAGPLAIAVAELGPEEREGGAARALSALGVRDVRSREIEGRLAAGGIVIAVQADTPCAQAAREVLGDAEPAGHA